MSIFEILMMACFGAAWPFSIARSLRTRSTAGKSPLFLVILCCGYFFGILHKFFVNYDFVVYLYFLNFIMVLTDLLLYIRNTNLQKRGETEKASEV